jgi:hypothetical protein
MSVLADAPLLGPLLVFAAVGVLALVLRWVYGNASEVPPPPAGLDFGLLRAITTVDDPEQASALRAMLADCGIRSTTSRTTSGRTIVLVFDGDVEGARQVLGPR